MKRQIVHVMKEGGSDTPSLTFAMLGKRHRLFGSPVDGLADTMANTPESTDAGGKPITSTEKQLAGFTLNTPGPQSEIQTPNMLKFDGVAPVRHRLANISNLPPLALEQEALKGSQCGSQPEAVEASHGVVLSQTVFLSSQTLTASQAAPVLDVVGPSSQPCQAAAAAAAAARLPALAEFTGELWPCGPELHPEDGCCFMLRTSQSYTRISSFCSPHDATHQGLSALMGVALEDPSQQFTTPTQDSKEPCRSLSSSHQGPSLSSHTTGEANPAVLQATQASMATAAAVMAGAAAGTLVDAELGPLSLPPALEETTTPELELVGPYGSQEPEAGSAGGGRAGRARGGSGAMGEREYEATTQQALFPIFRPKKQRKWLILVRHGESTYNRIDNESKNWGDPSVYDAPLTNKGCTQASSIRSQLAALLEKKIHDLGEPLWVSSPLTRAIETFLLACPCHDRLHLAGQQAGSSSSSAGAGVAKPPRVVVLSTIAEHCATTGDVGRPASQLVRAFPVLSGPLSELDEEWWYNPDPEGGPNCSQRRCMGRKESSDHMRQRVAEFSRWLHSRPEQLVVAFGHSTFWKHFANAPKRMGNCEVTTMWW